MSAHSRVPPAIRDHETLRMIGRGAYGEVWMARSVTGTLRAVKVLWREDYDHPDAFEREFQALKHYEPVSRKHPGLVPILQIGRSDTEGFYYYVMELADDLNTGRKIDPDQYVPHTLSAQFKRDKQLSVKACIEAGKNVAEGLHHLHQSGLIHRDIKPANLIFVDGVCKLADIGLVTLMGQRTFVGTEGFMAPEGPGSPASDVFSLGMVLYEASTGKDRLDFPDLPSYRDTSASLTEWRRLQDTICVACASKAAQRYHTAGEMALALAGKPLPSERRRAWVIGGCLAALALFFAGMWWARQQKQARFSPVRADAPPLLVLRSIPEGARVFTGEEDLGPTPLKLNPSVGLPMIYQFRFPGYKITEREHMSVEGKPQELTVTLEKSKLPQSGERWINSLGMAFSPRQGGHISAEPAEMKYFRTFTEDSDRAFEGKVVRMQSAAAQEPSYIVVVPLADAEAFRAWLTEKDRRAGYLSPEHDYELESFYYAENPHAVDERPEAPETLSNQSEREWQAFHLHVVRQTYGSVVIKTMPEGVKVYQHDAFLGETPLELPRVRSGTAEYELRKDNFSDLLLDGEVREGEILELYADMEMKKGVSYGREWKNSMGVRFVPLGDVLISVWETRRRDYAQFCKAASRKLPAIEDAELAQNINHTKDPKARIAESGKRASLPVISVTRADAQDYCVWLTEKERQEKVIGPDDEYRLPTDLEWSRAVGLPMERGATPAERSGRIRGMYPWGFDWPPPKDMDNLAGTEAQKGAGLDQIIQGFKDRSAYSVKVADLPPNDRGICGLGGNVSEWVETDFNKPKAGSNEPILGTVRGGNWRTYLAEDALSSTRQALPVDARRNTIGFRVVLSRK